MAIPENFDFLHRCEEAIRDKTKDAIEASEELVRHLNAVAGSMTATDHFARNYTGEGNDELTIQLLGIRAFNDSAGAVQCLMSGYYQNSVMIQRDLLEVSFLFRLSGIDQDARRRVEGLYGGRTK